MRSSQKRGQGAEHLRRLVAFPIIAGFPEINSSIKAYQARRHSGGAHGTEIPVFAGISDNPGQIALPDAEVAELAFPLVVIFEDGIWDAVETWRKPPDDRSDEPDWYPQTERLYLVPDQNDGYIQVDGPAGLHGRERELWVRRGWADLRWKERELWKRRGSAGLHINSTTL